MKQSKFRNKIRFCKSETPAVPIETHVEVSDEDYATIMESFGNGPGKSTDINNAKVFIDGNEMFFYENINLNSASVFNFNLNNLTKELQAKLIKAQLDGLPIKIEDLYINIHIMSDGGNVTEALSMVDRIISNKISINTFIEGCVASAGTFLSVVGKNRVMRKNAVMLLHQPSMVVAGRLDAINDEMHNVGLLYDKIKKIYLEYSKLTPELLDSLLSNEKYITADQALEYGLIDQIL